VEFHVDDTEKGQRLDHYLQEKLPEFSRSRVQEWIKAGRVLVGGTVPKASLSLKGGETIAVEPMHRPPLRAEAEDLPLDVLYQDDDVVVVNKAAGVVVHAGAGQHSGTLVNALLHHFGTLSTEGGDERPGIVHRLDKETSGVLVVARTDAAHRSLSEQFASREVDKIYLAMVQGLPKAESGRVEKPITRDPMHRTKMTCRLETGRHALTDWKVLRRFTEHSLLEVKLGTGRTHQIRVHLSSLGHPILGDRVYGARGTELLTDRFFLHAARLAFRSPGTGERISVEAPMPSELTAIIESGSL
jgi:23S rRNA pseudouridine1911/1915/1917 synthase